MGSAKTRAARKSPGRPLWIWLHKWVGIVTAFVMILLGLTGSVIVVWREADAWLNPALFTPSSAQIRVDADAALAIASATDRAPVLALNLPDEIHPVYVAIQFRDVDGRRLIYAINIDPANGRVLAERDIMSTAIGIVYFLHADLLLRRFGGREIVGVLGIVLLFSSISGIYLWWPKPGWFWRSVTFRWRAATPRLLLDMHNTAGFWTAIVLLVLAVSGIVLALPTASRSVIGFASPVTSYDAPSVPVAADQPRIRAADAVEMANRHLPGYSATNVSPPTEASETWRVYLSPTVQGNTRGLITPYLWINARTGVIEKEFSKATMSRGDFVYEAQLGLHNGMLLGTVGRTLIFLSGIALAAIAVTGLWLWIHKANAKRRTARRRAMSAGA